MKQVVGDVQKVVAGIDVGKRQLDVSVAAGPVKRFENTAAGITELLCQQEIKMSTFQDSKMSPGG